MTINLLSFKVLLCKLMVNLSGLRISSDWRSVFSLAGCCFAGCCRVVIHQFFCCYPPVGSCFYSLSPVVILQDIFETHLFGCCASQPFSVYSGNPQDSSTLGFPGVINLRISLIRQAWFGLVSFGWTPIFTDPKSKSCLKAFAKLFYARLKIWRPMVLEGRLTFLHAVPPAETTGRVDDASEPVNQPKNSTLKERLNMYPKKGVIKAKSWLRLSYWGGTFEGRFVDWLLDSSLVLWEDDTLNVNVLSDGGYGALYPWVKMHGTGPKTWIRKGPL